MRTFQVSLYHGVGNNFHTKAAIHADTAFKAYDAFCTEMRCIGYPLMIGRPETIDGITYSVWTGGCDISGQRIYVKERI